MPKIAAISTAVPPHVQTQDDVKSFAKGIFGDRLLSVFDNSMIKKRHFVAEQKWFTESHSFAAINDLYIESALGLTEAAVAGLVEKTGIPSNSIDAVFFISTTGLSTPSIDARLFNRMDFSPHVKRIPIWGLGCAGGAAGLARAHDYLKAYPKHRALVIAVEICSLAFQKDGQLKSNIIATALFGDGAAACLLVGDEADMGKANSAKPETLASYSTIYKDTLEVMGWDFSGEGFRVQLSRDIPAIVTALVKKDILEFLQLQSLALEDITHFVMHPGGMKVLHAYADSLCLPMERLKHSTDILQEYGNMSSVTVLFILQRFLETSAQANSYGLLSALGPGFSSELLLLRWN